MDRFPDTDWALVEQAKVGGVGSEVRKGFSDRYYRPVFAYLLARVRDRSRAEELTNSFFAQVFLTGRMIDRADPGRGRFRDLVRQAAKNFLLERARHWRRHEGREQVEHDDVFQRTASGLPSPDVVYFRECRRQLLKDVLDRVEVICRERGQTVHFEIFKGRYLDPGSERPWGELGGGLDQRAARNRAAVVLDRMRVVLREMLYDELGDWRAVDEEIRALLEDED
jgi:hypothetical protein